MTLDSAGLPSIADPAASELPASELPASGLPTSGLPASEDLPDPPPPATPPPTPRRPLHIPRPLRAAALLLLVLLAPPLLIAAHLARPTPYGDHLTGHATVHARVRQATTPQPPTPWPTHFRTREAAIEAYDPRTGATHWRYTREGRRPLSSVSSVRSDRARMSLHARVEAITLWDDGMVTDTDGRSVRWHRALPAAGDWLPGQGGTGVLRPLGRGILAVVTPHRVSAYRITDGDLRWVLPAREGCAFEPARAEHHGAALLIAQPCPHAAWTAQLVAVDDLGRIAPHRRPLGNEVGNRIGNEVVQEGGRPRSEHLDPEKVVARPR
ncbi:hypothetical protein [Streptomyces cyaneus]|uniref:hypothetical protein n=1 Tax=Streptomyces cyaneus TaxID=1904 RepID=UPI0015E8B8E1|nr:hypothetical protein [Streptomyces cyaneus]